MSELRDIYDNVCQLSEQRERRISETVEVWRVREGRETIPFRWFREASRMIDEGDSK